MTEVYQFVLEEQGRREERGRAEVHGQRGYVDEKDGGKLCDEMSQFFLREKCLPFHRCVSAFRLHIAVHADVSGRTNAICPQDVCEGAGRFYNI